MIQKKGSNGNKIISAVRIINANIKSAIFRTLIRLRLRRIIFDEKTLEKDFTRVSSSLLISSKMLEEIILANIEQHGDVLVVTNLKRAIAQLEKYNKSKKLTKLYVAGLRALGTVNLPLSIDFGETYVDIVDDDRGIKSLILFYQRCGHIEKPYKLLTRINPSSWKTKQTNKLKNELKLFKNGIDYNYKSSRQWKPRSRNILYHINQSLPHHSSGYAIRTHSLLTSLRNRAWKIDGYARIGYPNDRYDFTGVRTVGSKDIIDNVSYHFTPNRKIGIGNLEIEDYQNASVDLILRQAEEFKPAIIHCASNYSCGLAGTATAKLLGIPSIYEVRGLWHITRTAKQPEYANSDHYQMIERLEAQAASNADHVFAITDAVKNILIGQGVPEKKITILPNAVDIDQFKPIECNRRLKGELNLSGKVIMGYIGSFTGYEGLDDLLEAVALLRAKLGDVFGLLLVGDGTAYDELVALSRHLEIQDIVRFTGRVKRTRVQDYYSLIDIAVYPRKGVPVCEIVSPLKPLEAMAMGKAIVASEVKALAEMIVHERTGLLHARDDVTSLAEHLERLVLDPQLRTQLGEEARRWVIAKRTWRDIGKKVHTVYEQLINPKSVS